jgi:hypothetical protein
MSRGIPDHCKAAQGGVEGQARSLIGCPKDQWIRWHRARGNDHLDRQLVNRFQSVLSTDEVPGRTPESRTRVDLSFQPEEFFCRFG